jgi:arylsulfatase A-like enzyme
MIKKTSFLTLTASLTTNFIASTNVQAATPNIIFIFSDDHAYQAIGAYNDRFAQFNPTPNIDRLAKNGMRFDKCYVTNSICGPSRATILTGKYSHLNGFYKNGMTFNGSQQTFPKLLRKTGYQTAIIGKWHLGGRPTGFDYYEILRGQGKYFNPDFLTKNGLIKFTGYTTDIITEHALNWLKTKRDKSKPFMLMLQHKAPHRNWQPAPKYYSLYKDVQFPEPKTLFDDYSTRGTAVHEQDMMIKKTMSPSDLKLTPPNNLTKEQLEKWHKGYDKENNAFRKAKLKGKDLIRWKYQRYVRSYLRCVKSVDDSVGEVLNYLKESGLDKNTIVIYSSDQGFFLGEHGWFDKRFMFEETLRTPFIISWPGVTKPGSVNDKDIISNLDFAETFLDIADAKLPTDMQGASLVPILKGATPNDWRKTFYYHYYGYPDWHLVRKHEGVTDGKYKLIRYYTLGEEEFYDLSKDKNEVKNEINNPEYATAIERMREKLLNERKVLRVPTDKELDEKFKKWAGENSYLKYHNKKAKKTIK